MADRTVSVRLTATVDGFTAAMAKAQASAEKLGAGVQKASQTQSWKTASTGLIAFGAAAVGAAGLAISKFSEFDQAMSQVKATGDDARANIDGLTEAAQKWGAATKYSASEAAGGIESLLKAGVSATDVIGGGLEGALSLAATGNLGVADSAEVAATAMTQFGLAGSDIPHIADLIAAGAGKAQGEVSDMAMALKQSGLVASQFGLSIEETTGTLAAFASAGLIGSDAGTSFKTMLLRMSNPSAEAKTKMEELGIAAYDASGNFVGITDLAGQLKDKLADLPQAQRDAALATIFGSDAIRAANVLYEQGAEGIQGWIDQVNDAGYAAEAAAIKQDNLAGDLEKLGGAFDTLLTKAGEGSANGLRDITQNLTEFVEMLGRHGEAASTITAIVGALGGLALVAGGTMKAITAISEFRAALDSLGVISSVKGWIDGLKSSLDAAGSSLGRVSLGAAAVAAGMIALQAAGSAIQSSMDEGRVSADRYAQALDEMTSSGTLAADVQSSIATAMAGTTGTTKDFAGAITMLATDSGFAKWLDGSVMGLAGMKGNTQMAQEELSKLDSALSQMDAAQASKTFAQLTESLDMQRVSAGDLVGLFPEYASQLRATADAAGVASVSNEELAGWMQGTVPESVVAGQALAQLGLAHVDAAADADTQAAALQSLMDMQNQMAQAALGASSAETSYASALLNAGDAAAAGGYSIDEATGKIDLHTKAGIQAQSALDNLAAAALNNRDAMKENGASMEELQAATQTARDDFIGVATQMGLSAEAANALADKYGLIPGQVVTDVSTTGTDASQAQIDAVKAAIDTLPPEMQTMIRSAWDDAAYSVAQASIAGLPPETQAMIMSAWNSGGYDSAVASLESLPPEQQAMIRSAWDAAGVNAAIAALASVQGKTVYIDTVYRSLDQRVAYNIGQPGRAGGGPIFGPGTATSDSIPAWLSNGEFVIRTAAAERLGYGVLDYINRWGHLPQQGYAAGGQVAPLSRQLVQSAAPVVNVQAVPASGDYLTRADLDGLGIKIIDPGIGKAIAAEIVLTAKRV